MSEQLLRFTYFLPHISLYPLRIYKKPYGFLFSRGVKMQH